VGDWETSRERRSKRQRSASSESSFIDSSLAFKFKEDIRNNPGRQADTDAKIKNHRENQLLHLIPSSQHSTSRAQLQKETFEKRKRHKTRVDRYKPTRVDCSPVREAVQKWNSSRKYKRGDSGKAAKKAGDDLIQNFSSNRIGNDRLTVCIWQHC
jgi:hypothetical protein